MPKTLLSIAAAAALCLSLSAAAADAEHGQALHAEKCVACHTNLTGGKPDQIYTGAKHTVNNRDMLWARVQMCEQNLGLKLFDEDIDDIAAYLNDTFYHFPTK